MADRKPLKQPKYVNFFTLPDGKQILKDLIKQSKLDSYSLDTTSDGSIDPFHLMFLQGRRSMICYIIQRAGLDMRDPKFWQEQLEQAMPPEYQGDA